MCTHACTHTRTHTRTRIHPLHPAPERCVIKPLSLTSVTAVWVKRSPCKMIFFSSFSIKTTLILERGEMACGNYFHFLQQDVFK